MIHGVCPPLTARANRPRAAIAARASAAIIAAAVCATESASWSTSTFNGLSPISLSTHSPDAKNNHNRSARPAFSSDLRGNAEIFQVSGIRVMPASGGQNSLINLPWTPRAFFIFKEGSAGLQRRIDDSPRLFHVILAGKQGSISRHGVAQHAFIRLYVFRTRMTAGYHLHIFTF